MGWEEILEKNLSRWASQEGPEGDIVLSSRIRLARNLNGILFPRFANEAAQRVVLDSVRQAAEKSQKTGFNWSFIPLAEVSPLERGAMVERHLISPNQAEDVKYKAVMVSPDEIISIMVNEEDHLRIQVILPGLDLEKAWEMASQIDDILEQYLDFAFSDKIGYLTACPTNVGTGLRASAMLHLPALTMTNQIRRLVAASSQLGLAVRGIYGEGTEAMGNLYQISNQITLGQSEAEIIQHLAAVTRQIIEQERNTRQAMMEQSKVLLEDRIGRALGVLAHARRMDTQEAMQLLSDLRLGVDLNLVHGLPRRKVDQLMMAVWPALLQKIMGQELGPEERDLRRAALIRECVAGARI